MTACFEPLNSVQNRAISKHRFQHVVGDHHFPDVCPECTQLADNILIAALNMFDVLDLGDPFGGHCGDQYSRARPEIDRAYRCAGEAGSPFHNGKIEAGTYMVAAAATGGDVLVKNVIPKHLEAISQKLEKAGATVIEYDDSIRVIREGALNKVNVKTMPHPGFPTDMQPQIHIEIDVPAEQQVGLGVDHAAVDRNLCPQRFKPLHMAEQGQCQNHAASWVSHRYAAPDDRFALACAWYKHCDRRGLGQPQIDNVRFLGAVLEHSDPLRLDRREHDVDGGPNRNHIEIDVPAEQQVGLGAGQMRH